jgi:hypothetical protein
MCLARSDGTNKAGCCPVERATKVNVVVINEVNAEDQCIGAWGMTPPRSVKTSRRDAGDGCDRAIHLSKQMATCLGGGTPDLKGDTPLR